MWFIQWRVLWKAVNEMIWNSRWVEDFSVLLWSQSGKIVVFRPSHPGISDAMNALVLHFNLREIISILKNYAMNKSPWVSFVLSLGVVGVWRLRGTTQASGAPGKEEERAASCLTVCWTDYSLIAVDVKADEVITWPVWCGRARPCDKVNPPCVCSSGCCL